MVYLCICQSTNQCLGETRKEGKKERKRTHHRKYNPQLLAFPTKFGVIPLYNPLTPPSLLIISLSPPVICPTNPLFFPPFAVETCS